MLLLIAYSLRKSYAFMIEILIKAIESLFDIVKSYVIYHLFITSVNYNSQLITLGKLNLT